MFLDLIRKMHRLLLNSKNYLRISSQSSAVYRFATTSLNLDSTANDVASPAAGPQKAQTQPTATNKPSIKDIFFVKRAPVPPAGEIFNMLKERHAVFERNDWKAFNMVMDELGPTSTSLEDVSSLMKSLANNMDHVLPRIRKEKLDMLWGRLKKENLAMLDGGFYLAYMKAVMSLDVDLISVKNCLEEMKQANINYTPDILSLQFDAMCRLG